MAADNPYTILGVTTQATDAEIKAAYKRLAFKYHPDRNKGSLAHTEHFKRIVAAYAILSDPHSRARYDRQSGVGRQSYTVSHSAASAGQASYGPSPYGGRYTGYDPLSGNGAARGGAGQAPPRVRRYTSPTAHQIFIALTMLACCVMVSLWFGSLMNRNTAKNRLAEGDYIGAIEYDSTYGEAWFMLGRRLAEVGRYEGALNHMHRAIVLTDDVPAAWHYHKGRVEEHLGNEAQARASYKWALRGLPNQQELAVTDSATIRLARLELQDYKRADTAAVLLSGLSPRTKQTVAAVYLRGLAAFYTGQYSSSIALLQRSADSLYLAGASYYYLGQAYWATADTAMACKAWDIALTSGDIRGDSLMRLRCTFTPQSPDGALPYTIHVQQSRSTH